MRVQKRKRTELPREIRELATEVYTRNVEKVTDDGERRGARRKASILPAPRVNCFCKEDNSYGCNPEPQRRRARDHGEEVGSLREMTAVYQTVSYSAEARLLCQYPRSASTRVSRESTRTLSTLGGRICKMLIPGDCEAVSATETVHVSPMSSFRCKRIGRPLSIDFLPISLLVSQYSCEEKIISNSSDAVTEVELSPTRARGALAALFGCAQSADAQ